MEFNFIEKDAIGFLGLMAIAFKNFDTQFKHVDGEMTHTKGLNIFAAIIDNTDGSIIGQQQNRIHEFCNPMLHAEQLTLKQAVDLLHDKRPRNPQATSVENYYRKYLFNQPDTVGNFDVGATIYTTLEPCPFCTAALLVNRMKRIVYIMPDGKYGHSFSNLKNDYYKSYDITYAKLETGSLSVSELASFADKQYKILMDYVVNHLEMNATLYLDEQKHFLESCRETFLGFSHNSLVTTGNAKIRNAKTLNDFKQKAR